jgi:hypothetical protein
MMRCPDCVDGRLNHAYALFRDLPCCRARSLAETPRKRQKAVADTFKRVFPGEWPAIRQEALDIMEERAKCSSNQR